MARRPTYPQREALESQLAAARGERDAALLSLAREREAANALRLGLEAAAFGLPPAYPEAQGPGEPAVRYVLADIANDALKRYFARGRPGGKRIAAFVASLATRSRSA